MDGIQIQMQDPSGNWRTYNLTTNFSMPDSYGNGESSASVP
jgi:hypothetical protein